MLTKNKETANCYGYRLSVNDGDKEVARTFLYVLHNDIRGKEFGYIEDVFVEEGYRGNGIATGLVNDCITLCRALGCYKIVLATQYEYLHHMYKKIGFKKSGTEFKIYL